MRLLLSARDVGAAEHIAAIAEEAGRDPHIECIVVAEGPALQRLRAHGIETQPFRTRPIDAGSPQSAAALLAEAAAVVADTSPDAVLVGLSHSRESGVDEALLAVAGPRRTYALQDFWGDVNANLGTAQTYLVIDEEARRLTTRRHAVRTVVVGSPKHARYADLDVLELRRRTRARLGVDGDAPLIGFFGQQLQPLPGYRDTLSRLGAALRTHGGLMLHRPHPRETDAQARAMHDLLEHPGARVHTTRDGPVEAALAAVDVVVSVFSTCGYDALFLNRYSPRPLNTVLYLLFDPSVRAHVRDELAMDALPPVSAGLATAVLETEELEPALDLALTAGERDRRWRASQSLPDPATSARRVLETLHADFDASSSSVARGA